MAFQYGTPDSLDDWRAFVAYQPEKPVLLSPEERDELSEEAREAYDDARVDFINAPRTLLTPNIEKLLKVQRRVIAMNRGAQFTARQSIAISGTQTMGKSTAAMYLGRQHEVSMRRRSGLEDDYSYVPVLYLTASPQSTPKGLMLSFAHALDLPVSARANTQQVMNQVVRILKELGTSMVILDEIQQLKTGAQIGMEAASALKLFTERVPATFIYVGVDLQQSDLFGGQMGRQMQGRTTMFSMSPFTLGSHKHRENWERLIAQFEREFPLYEHEVGSLTEEAAWLHARTGGVIGSLRTLLRKGQIQAIYEDQEYLDRELLKGIESDYRSQLRQSEMVNDSISPGHKHARTS